MLSKTGWYSSLFHFICFKLGYSASDLGVHFLASVSWKLSSYWAHHQPKLPHPLLQGCIPASCPPVLKHLQDYTTPGAEPSIIALSRNVHRNKQRVISHIYLPYFATKRLWWKYLPKPWDIREWSLLWEFCITAPCKLSIPVSCCFQVFVDELMLSHCYPDICNSFLQG